MTDVNSFPVKGKHKPHQERALKEADQKQGHAYFMDPGAGKTRTCIAEAGHLFKKGKIDGVIIIAPNGPHIQWVDEQFPLWADYDFYPLHNKISPAKLKKMMTQARIYADTECGVLTLNYEGAITAKGKALVNDFMKVFPRIYLVIDESQKVKDVKAQRTTVCRKLAGRCVYRRLLTGTPILKGLEDLFSQYDIVSPGITGYNSFWLFKDHYCVQERIWGAGVDPRATKIVGYQNEQELTNRVKNHVTIVKAEEFMDGKPMFIPVSTPMGADQAKAYRTMKDHLVALMDDGMVTAQNALVQLTKLLQIASGFVYGEDGETTWYGRNKIDAALNLLEQLNEPSILWSPFRAMSDRMEFELERSTVADGRVYDFPVTRYVDRDSITRWKDVGGVLIANQGSGAGVGQNLQNAAANIYMANTFSAEHRWQSIKRTDRIGQKRQVRVWDLISPETADLKSLASLEGKQELSDKQINALVRDVLT